VAAARLYSFFHITCSSTAHIFIHTSFLVTVDACSVLTVGEQLAQGFVFVMHIVLRPEPGRLANFLFSKTNAGLSLMLETIVFMVRTSKNLKQLTSTGVCESFSCREVHATCV